MKHILSKSHKEITFNLSSEQSQKPPAPAKEEIPTQKTEQVPLRPVIAKKPPLHDGTPKASQKTATH